MGLFDKMQQNLDNAQQKIMETQQRINQRSIDRMQQYNADVEERRASANTNEQVEISKADDKKLLAEKQKNETYITQTICDGDRVVKTGITKTTKIWKQSDGLIYFDKAPNDIYKVIGLDWDGAVYQEVTQTTGTSKTKSKRKGRLVGAAVGTMVLGPLGTAIGAGVGTGNKAGKVTSNSTTVSQTVEVPSIATLHIEDLSTGIKSHIGLSVDSKSIHSLKDFLDIPLNEDPASSIDPYEELRKLKDLLDNGIITQDDFDAKKQQLLNI